MSSTSLRIGLASLAGVVLAVGGFASGWITRGLTTDDARIAVEPISVESTTTIAPDPPIDDEAGMPSATAVPPSDPAVPHPTTPIGTPVAQVGEEISSGDITLRVDSADINACRDSARPIGPKHMWVILDITLTNNTDRNADTSGAAWGLWDADNHRYEDEYFGPDDCHPPADDSGGTLSAYSTVQYTIYFEVPDDLSELQFRYTRASALLAVALR